MARKFWWPGSQADQLILMQNFLVKFALYGPGLGFNAAAITAAQMLCNAFIGAVNATEQARQTMQAMTQWRDDILTGDADGRTPQAPVFPVVGPVTYPAGVVKSFMRLRDQIVASANYTTAIGEDLGIVGAETGRIVPSDLTPDLKAETSTGYMVNLSGSMQGMDALKVEYSRDGGEHFQTVAFLTNTPGGFQINPATPNQPEKGVIRAVFIKKNEEFGNYSANYPVTVS